MIRLHIIAEGQTEREFANTLLAQHLVCFSVFLDARCVLTGRDKRQGRVFRGGVLNYQKAKADIQTWIKEDNHYECRFSTMFDLYALPTDFPQYEEAKKQNDPYDRVAILERAMEEDIGDRRFKAYIQLHEFEALILADPQKLDCEYLEHKKPIADLLSMVGEQNPEMINDGYDSAPSKRILRLIPQYDKVSAGVSVTKQIGLEKLREKCRHFNDWVNWLESLGGGS